MKVVTKFMENWDILTEVYNQDEVQLIAGLLTMAGIPVKIDREAAADIYGLTIGPLAKIVIWIPAGRKQEAEKILSGEVENNTIPEDNE